MLRVLQRLPTQAFLCTERTAPTGKGKSSDGHRCPLLELPFLTINIPARWEQFSRFIIFGKGKHTFLMDINSVSSLASCDHDAVAHGICVLSVGWIVMNYINIMQRALGHISINFHIPSLLTIIRKTYSEIAYLPFCLTDFYFQDFYSYVLKQRMFRDMKIIRNE